MSNLVNDAITPRQQAIDIGIALTAATAMAAAVALTISPSAPVSPLRVAVLNDIIAGRSVAYTPYPVGYVAFAAVAIRWFGMRGLAAAQGALYVATVLLAYATLCGLRVGRRAALAGALAVAVYQYALCHYQVYGHRSIMFPLVGIRVPGHAPEKRWSLDRQCGDRRHTLRNDAPRSP